MNSQSRLIDRAAAEALAGTWRRFGETGPLYQIIGVSERPADEPLRMIVRVLHTDETIDYKLSDLLQDPRET